MYLIRVVVVVETNESVPSANPRPRHPFPPPHRHRGGGVVSYARKSRKPALLRRTRAIESGPKVSKTRGFLHIRTADGAKYLAQSHGPSGPDSILIESALNPAEMASSRVVPSRQILNPIQYLLNPIQYLLILRPKH